MSTASTLTWEQYQKLPPSKRSRPLTPAEYAALTRQQRAAAGLEDDETAPADFGGPVFPNPDHVQVRSDDEPPIDATRLPNGASFSRQNYTGGAQMDTSNPDPAQVIPSAMGQEIQAKTTGAPMRLPPGAVLDSATADSDAAMKLPPGATLESAPAAKTETPTHDRFAEDRAITEAWAEKHPILGPIARFLVAGGQNAANAVTDTPGQLYHAIVDPPTAEEAGLTPEQRVIARLGVKQAIEAGQDYAAGKVTPKGAASVLPEALGAGVGQVAGGSVYGKAGEVAPDLVRAGAGAISESLDSPTGAALRAGTKAALKKLPASAVKRIPYVGNVAGDVADAARTAYQNAKTPTPTYPGAPFPELSPESRLPAAFQPRPAELAGPPGSASNPFQSTAAAPVRAGSMVESVTAEPPAAAAAPASTPAGAGVPRTLSGESVLREELTKQPNNILLKIAKSRGVDVSQESLLKPSNAVNNKIINKIVEDYAPDELDEVRSRRLDAELNGRHNFGDIGKEANQTLSLQTYFPELKIPAAQQVRTATAIRNAEIRNPLPETAPVTDVAAQIKNTTKTAAKAAKPRTVVVDPSTGRPEFSDVVAAKQGTAQNPATATPAASEDLTDLLTKSVKPAQAARAAKNTITHGGQDVPRFVYRARDVGEQGVPLSNTHAQATSDLNQAMKYAEPGQRGEGWGQVVRIDLSKLKPGDFVVRSHPDGMKWVQFTRPLTEDEVSPFAGKNAGAKQNVGSE